MAKPVEVYLANTTPTPFNLELPDVTDQRGRIVLALHRHLKPSIRVTFDRRQWIEITEALTAALVGKPHPSHC